MKRIERIVVALLGLLMLSVSAQAESQIESLIQTVQEVGREGKGHQEAQEALKKLRQKDGAALIPILKSFNKANPLAANWLRSAFECISDREIEQGRGLPQDALEQFIRDRDQNPRARRLAYEWLLKVDSSAKERLIPGMLRDPSSAMRRDAVQRLISQAEKLSEENKKKKAVAIYQKALSGATDQDQVKAIVQPLKKLGHEVDLQTHFGFLARWHLIGPFDNRDEKGFDVIYPPEKEIDLQATYEGQKGKVSWVPHKTDHKYGIVDLNEALARHKGACVYAVTTFVSDKKRDVEFRLATPNAWKLWLNGELLFAREEYHRGMRFDQYPINATLQPGKNTILLKICQNEQTQDWAQRWRYQIRVCDSSGAAILSQNRQKTKNSQTNSEISGQNQVTSKGNNQ